MKYMTRIAAAALAVTLAGPVIAQDVQDAADASMVLDNVAKGVANNSRLTTAIPGATMSVPIKSTGYFGGGGGTGSVASHRTNAEVESDFIGTLGIGTGRRCPLVNAHRSEDTYMPGGPFMVRNCGVTGGISFWVGIRVYGMICSAGSPPMNCQSLKDPLNNPAQYETGGYIALLKPGVACSSGRWPTEALRSAGAPAYAEWCDYGVYVP